MAIGLTLFTTCKPFVGRSAMIQRNALRSWRQLCPPCEVLVFGNEAGVEGCCAELGFRHFPEVARNEFGTPLINNLFAQAERSAQNDYLAYVNADIMLTSDVIAATQTVRALFDKFLLIARRWNVDVDSEWEFAPADWDGALRRYAAAHGTLEPPDGGTDVFVYRRGSLQNLPPFAIGRSRCDSMVILETRRRGLPVIDATEVLTSLHQNHDYSHIARATDERIKGPESSVNERMLGGKEFIFTSLNATHVATKAGIERNGTATSEPEISVGTK
jgi:hypothetical protein